MALFELRQEARRLAEMKPREARTEFSRRVAEEFTIPDEGAEVDWYISEGRAVGVDKVSDSWSLRPIPVTKTPAGFEPPRDERRPA